MAILTRNKRAVAPAVGDSATINGYKGDSKRRLAHNYKTARPTHNFMRSSSLRYR